MAAMTARDIMALWPSRAVLADEIGVRFSSVQMWQVRNRIPSRHWPALLRASRKRRLGLTLETLDKMPRVKAS